MIAALLLAFAHCSLANIPFPAGSVGLTKLLVLPNRNIVIVTGLAADPSPLFGRKAVHLLTPTGQLISTLRGTQIGDEIGSGGLVQVPGTSHFFVLSPNWSNGDASRAGAVTWVDGDSGLNGEVSAANSVVGSLTDDRVGKMAPVFLDSGMAVISAPHWNNGAMRSAGAVRVVPGDAPSTGAMTPENAIVGTRQQDLVGASFHELFFDRFHSAVRTLPGGHFLLQSPYWAHGSMFRAGAVTFVPASGLVGSLDSSNSLVGSTAGQSLGLLRDSITSLADGSMLLSSSLWSGAAGAEQGAIVRLPQDQAVVGEITADMALTGRQAGDRIGTKVLALPNGSALITSPLWDNGGAINAGAVTWMAPGSTLAGQKVDETNSLVGSQTDDQVGSGGVVLLANGNAVAVSPRWNNGAAAQAGAATWISASDGRAGELNAMNSLVGEFAGSHVGGQSSLSTHLILPLPNGHYVVRSPLWTDGQVTNAGAATWADGTTGGVGLVDASNSLVGASSSDGVGSSALLVGDNTILDSRNWRNTDGVKVRAFTWMSGSRPTVGQVSPLNSFVGGETSDLEFASVFGLPNGDALISTQTWQQDRGALTWIPATGGRAGVVGSENSLVGKEAGDRFGSGRVLALADGTVLVSSPYWSAFGQSRVGAIHAIDPSVHQFGVLADADAMLGAQEDDVLGRGGMWLSSSGSVLIHSPVLSLPGSPQIGGITRLTSAPAGQVPTTDNTFYGAAQFDMLEHVGFTVLPGAVDLLLFPQWNVPGQTARGRLMLIDPSEPINADLPLSRSAIDVEFHDEFSASNQARYTAYDTLGRRLLVGRPLSARISILEPFTSAVFEDGFEEPMRAMAAPVASLVEMVPMGL